jgi:2-oxo-4-hydroxy-4-carboxy-5-ureidoimidazoline decarboxylase
VVLHDLPGQLTVAGLTIAQVNGLDRDGFVAAFGQVYESTPGLAEAAWGGRPFADRDGLVRAFRAAADRLDGPSVLALLRAHPQLAAGGAMTAASADEQRSAGLSDLDRRTGAEIVAGNARYFERFGFPFIIAVRGLQPADVGAALAERLDHDQAEEQATALAQVQRIAELRIDQLVAP